MANVPSREKTWLEISPAWTYSLEVQNHSLSSGATLRLLLLATMQCMTLPSEATMLSMQSTGNTMRFKQSHVLAGLFLSSILTFSNVRLAASHVSSTLQRAPPSTGLLVLPTSHMCTGTSHFMRLICFCDGIIVFNTSVCGTAIMLWHVFLTLYVFIPCQYKQHKRH